MKPLLLIAISIILGSVAACGGGVVGTYENHEDQHAGADVWRLVIAGYAGDRYEEFSACHDSTEFVVFRFRGEDRLQGRFNRDTDFAPPA